MTSPLVDTLSGVLTDARLLRDLRGAASRLGRALRQQRLEDVAAEQTLIDILLDRLLEARPELRWTP